MVALIGGLSSLKTGLRLPIGMTTWSSSNWIPLGKDSCSCCANDAKRGVSQVHFCCFDVEEENSITRYWGAEVTGVPPTDARQGVGRGTGSSPAEVDAKGFSREQSKGVWLQAKGTLLPSTSTKVAMQTWSPKNWRNLRRFVCKGKSHGTTCQQIGTERQDDSRHRKPSTPDGAPNKTDAASEPRMSNKSSLQRWQE